MPSLPHPEERARYSAELTLGARTHSSHSLYLESRTMGAEKRTVKIIVIVVVILLIIAYETTIPDDPPRAPCSIHNRHEQQIRSNNCEMAMRVWAPCTVDEFYGYNMGTPCVFLRLNYVSIYNSSNQWSAKQRLEVFLNNAQMRVKL
ncbi:unnamed protein product [Diatraea saccharalis]|uniref:Uncharacterized protein n=1 Tax=Diatraea saccharalis TaxID=40085 RepID=A0A9N9WC18_9NEOP|nr:unnamed protein product [Diatraea saccharalis]